MKATDRLRVKPNPTINGDDLVFINAGELVEVLHLDHSDDTVFVTTVDRPEIQLEQWIDRDSLEGSWGDLLDPNVIHDFVYEGDDE